MKHRIAHAVMVILAVLGIVTLKPEVARAQSKGIVASATAGYQVTFGGAERTVEFAAQRDSANNSRGEGHLFNHVTSTKIHFVIDCLNVVGNMATISGTIDHSDVASFPEGTPIWLRVVDNGEGRKSPPDLVSPLFAIFGPPVACTTPLAAATLAIEGGNIQVH